MSAASRRRQSRARASFGPEWRPLGGMAGWLVENGPPRRRERFTAHLRAARRDLATAEGRALVQRVAEVATYPAPRAEDYVLAAPAGAR